MPLEAGGYYYQQGSTLNLAADAGFRKRQKLFLTENSTVYSGEAATLCGPIYHDLITCEAGVPPGIAIDLTLYRNKPQIAIDSFDSSPNYVFKVKSAYLHCPIGRLSSEVFSKYEMNLQKKAATLRIKRWMVKGGN